jgi:RNA polymerase-binding transcription factor DksA
MDEKTLEFAEALAASLLENGIEKVRAQVRQRDPNFDGLCVDCSDEIPERRVDTGAVTCTECQQERELRALHYKR